MIKELSTLIKLSAKIREESFDHVKAEKMQKEYTIHYNMPDYNNCYNKSISESVQEAIIQLKMDNKLLEPVYLLLQNAWNDSLQWANSI